MPTVGVSRDLLFQKIGREFSDDEFDKLCFDFGIELDKVVDTDPLNVEYKIDIPANRYDLLCVEGIATALSVFMNTRDAPRYNRIEPGSSPITTKVLPTTKQVRPYILTAVLRGISMSPSIYSSLIDLQEKLHHNICRKRALVAIGVHDLDTLTPPFTYGAEPGNQIQFRPLNQEKVFRADELMEFYTKDTHLKPYLHLIKDEPLFPVIRDATGTVLSLPPIINGDHSKVSMDTRNIFIECTARDETKANIVLDTLVAMLSEYAQPAFSVEVTKVIYEDRTVLSPKLAYKMEVMDVGLANRTVGIELDPETMAKSLSRMGLRSIVMSEQPGKLNVEIPPTRHDVLHQCDIMEDVAISYGYSNLIPLLPPTPTVASQFPLNNLTSKLRAGVAQAGFTEVLTFSLCSVEDECRKLRQAEETKEPLLARIQNPKSSDFQVVRASLLPGLLKTVQANMNAALPLKLFEISDVVILDGETDTGAKNVRSFCALVYNKTPGLEVVHGLLDRFMTLLETPFGENGYCLKPKEDPTYFSGRSAEVLLNGKVIGSIGVLHPEVIDNFGLKYPCSALEIQIEDFL